MLIFSVAMYLLVFVLSPVLAGFTTVLSQKRCSVLVKARCCGSEAVFLNRGTWYRSKFVYEIDGHEVSGTAPLELVQCEEGTVYDIFVNPNNYSEIVLCKGYPIGGYMMIGLGLVMLVLFCIIIGRYANG